MSETKTFLCALTFEGTGETAEEAAKEFGVYLAEGEHVVTVQEEGRAPEFFRVMVGAGAVDVEKIG